MSLSAEEYDEGISLCKENCSRYLKDAEILLRNESYGHALGLSVLAMEEYAKKIILMAVKFGLTKADKQFWKNFRSHDFNVL